MKLKLVFDFQSQTISYRDDFFRDIAIHFNEIEELQFKLKPYDLPEDTFTKEMLKMEICIICKKSKTPILLFYLHTQLSREEYLEYLRKRISKVIDDKSNLKMQKIVVTEKGF